METGRSQEIMARTFGTVPAQAKKFGLSEGRLRILLKSGEIRGAKAGSKFLVTDAAIVAWLNGEVPDRDDGAGGGLRKVAE